jgi:hypothetical protein
MPKAGETFVLTSGDYSDYTIRGHYRAKRDFSLREEKDRYVEQLPMVPVLQYGEIVPDPTARMGRRWVLFDVPRDTGEMRKEYSSIDGFQAHLVRQDLVEELEVVEFNYDLSQ